MAKPNLATPSCYEVCPPCQAEDMPARRLQCLHRTDLRWVCCKLRRQARIAFVSRAATHRRCLGTGGEEPKANRAILEVWAVELVCVGHARAVHQQLTGESTSSALCSMPHVLKGGATSSSETELTLRFISRPQAT